MEVNSESGIMSGREPFSVGMQMQRPPVPASQPHPVMPNMRMSYAADGTAGYKPVTTFSPSPYYGGFGSAGGAGASSTATSAATAAAASGGGDWNFHIQAVPAQGLNLNVGEPVKRKRGRPRKYGPNGTMAQAPVSHATAGVTPGSGTYPPVSPPGTASPASASASAAGTKKARGRPPGSSRKQQMDALGSSGIGFTPHVITVKAGEDVQSKIMSFSQNGPRAVCILSANGAISNVTLHQAATSGGTVTYEGRFEILSLSGSILLSESGGGQRNRTGGLSVSLAGPDGRVLGGGVAGLLTAASPVQVVVSSFIAGGRKESKPATSPSDLASTPGNFAPGGMTGAASPPSRGTISESSSGPGSPLNQSTGACNDVNQQGMYNMTWK